MRKNTPSYFSGAVQLQKMTAVKIEQARTLRKIMTPAERVLWAELRMKRCNNLKFRRQQVIDGFIVDFFCAEKNLVIEIDGSVHELEVQKKIDEHRREVFKMRGLREIRFRNEEVLSDLDGVLREVGEVCKAAS
jgi:very-short-patch-repair endonuclease